jgi:hypothetical protein
MRYSAIRIFGDGSFMAARFYRHDAIHTLNVADNAGRLRGFFNKNKYVVVTSSEDTDFTYMLFREEHPMFNLPIMSKKTYLNNSLMYGPIHDILKGLLKDFNNNTI